MHGRRGPRGGHAARARAGGRRCRRRVGSRRAPLGRALGRDHVPIVVTRRHADRLRRASPRRRCELALRRRSGRPQHPRADRLHGLAGDQPGALGHETPHRLQRDAVGPALERRSDQPPRHARRADRRAARARRGLHGVARRQAARVDDALHQALHPVRVRRDRHLLVRRRAGPDAAEVGRRQRAGALVLAGRHAGRVRPLAARVARYAVPRRHRIPDDLRRSDGRRPGNRAFSGTAGCRRGHPTDAGSRSSPTGAETRSSP